VAGASRAINDALAISALSLASLTSLAFVSAPLVGLFWLMQPTVRPNPGIAAYELPAGTRLEPPVRTMASVDIAQTENRPSLAFNFARAYPQPEVAQDQAQPQRIKESSQRPTRVFNRQRARRAPKHGSEGTAFAYAGDRFGERLWGSRDVPRYLPTWH